VPDKVDFKKWERFGCPSPRVNFSYILPLKYRGEMGFFLREKNEKPFSREILRKIPRKIDSW
jgi:hypothetical protein